MNRMKELQAEVEWYRTVMAEHGYGGPTGDAVNPLRDWLQELTRLRIQQTGRSIVCPWCDYPNCDCEV